MNTIQQTNPGKNLRSVSIIGVGCTPFREFCADPEFDGLTEGEVYGYIAAKGDKFILMLRNSGDKAAEYSFTLPGAGRVSGELAPFEIKFSDNLK